MTNVERLRLRIGESIPAGSTDADTLFSNDQISQFLVDADQDLDAATLLAWEAKAAALAGLVTVREGASQRNLSDLHKQALDQVKHWRGITGGAANHTRIHNIERT